MNRSPSCTNDNELSQESISLPPSSSGGKYLRWLLIVICLQVVVIVRYNGVQERDSRSEDEFAIVTRTGMVLSADDRELGACSGFDGVLHVSQGDVEGAAGTIFFLFVLNQLLYAKKFNLIPWVHLNNISRHVFDPQVHCQGANGAVHDFEMIGGVNVSWTRFTDSISGKYVSYPGKPVKVAPTLFKCNVSVIGNGVWESYFEPVSAFSPYDPSCNSLPLIRLTHEQIIPALHVFTPWSLRAWRYGGLPPTLRMMEKNYSEWFRPMREQGHALVAEYVRFRPHLRKLADELLPPTMPKTNGLSCLALHIRHSDKANRRKKIPVHRFWPYVNAYFQKQVERRGTRNMTNDHLRMDYNQQPHEAQHFSIFLATDSSKVIDLIQKEWPKNVVSTMRWQDDAIRSNDSTATFKMISTHPHETNTQVLVDILAMSKCQYFLHGLSAVSEAVHYLNPNLHAASVNLEDRKQDIITVDRFRDMITS